MDAAIAELTLAEEIFSFAQDAGLSKRELGSLKRILAKRKDSAILAALCKLSGISAADSEQSQALGILYSLTETQIAELEWTLKSLQGWD